MYLTYDSLLSHIPFIAAVRASSIAAEDCPPTMASQFNFSGKLTIFRIHQKLTSHLTIHLQDTIDCKI